MANPINIASYSGLDFDTHFDDLLARTQSNFSTDFNDFALSSLGMMLLDLEAHGLEQLSFYLDRRATDTYMETARTRRSVAKLARQLGYKLRSAVSSSVDLEVAVTLPVPFPVPIAKGVKFQGPNDLVFEAAKDVTFAPGDGPTVKRIVPCFEGESFSETFVSSGDPNQTFELRKVPANKFVVSGSVAVLVDGVPYVESEFLKFENSNQFEVGYNSEPPYLLFGDGTTGTIPLSGATITVSYVAARGKTGQVAKGTITKTVIPLVVNFQTISLSINNPSASVGGDDPETLEHAKAFAGKVFKTRQVAITRQDYESLAGSFADSLFGRVAVAQAISSRSANNDLFLKTQLGVINTAASLPLPIVQAAGIDATIQIGKTNTETGIIGTAYTNAITLLTQADGANNNAQSDVRDVKNKTFEVSANVFNIQTAVADAKAAVNLIPIDAKSALTSADQLRLTAFLDKINGQASAAITSVNSITASADSAINFANAVRDGHTNAGNVELIKVSQSNTNIIANMVTLSADVAAIFNAVTDESNTIATATDALMSHIDKVLAADCKSNLVTVPILARDAAGFYAAPSIGLTQAVQSFLEARKEVTQTVKVTSGVDFLIQAVITLRVGVKPGFAESTTKAAVEAVVDGVLRDRKFGVSLFVSDIDFPVRALTAVEFVNVHIRGHLGRLGVLDPSKLDVDGNLIISPSEIISKGTVTVTTELAS